MAAVQREGETIDGVAAAWQTLSHQVNVGKPIYFLTCMQYANTRPRMFAILYAFVFPLLTSGSGSLWGIAR